MRVNCHLCGKPQNAPEINSLIAMMAGKEPSKKRIEEIKNTGWKYVCCDCVSTPKYIEWQNSPDSLGHIALTEDAKIID